MVRLRIATVLSIALSALLFVTSASAEQLVPPTPKWWPAGGYELRPGNWIACNEGRWAKNDCIESIEIKPINGGEWKALKFEPNPLFIPESTVPTRLNAETQNDYAFFPSTEPGVIGNDGLWVTTSGQITNTENLGLVVDAGFWGGPEVSGYFQLFLRPKIWNKGLNDQFVYRIKIKSKMLSSYARWVQLPTQAATLDWSDGYVTYTATPGIFYWPVDEWDEMCKGVFSRPRANLELAIVQFAVQIWNNEKQAVPPGQVIVSSNGNQCFRGLTFDKKTQTLNVQVGTVHFDTEGKQIEGWFNALIARDLLINWWGFDPMKSKGSARVEVTYEDGTTTVATTVSSYLEKTEQLRITASGFHYSAPLVSVSLIPEKESTIKESYRVEILPLTSKSRKLNLVFDSALAGQLARISLERMTKGKPTLSSLGAIKLTQSGRLSIPLKSALRDGDVVIVTANSITARARVWK